MEKSLGEKRVRIEFNPSDSSHVYMIKAETAALINRLEDIRQHDLEKLNGDVTDEQISIYKEKFRLIELAQTHYETAVMYAVKAVTS